MRYQKLQIKLLSQSGELLRVISCFPRQVSVFRATSSSELRTFQRALAGIPGPERISISLDDQTFRPEEHILIGFGESFAHEKFNSSVQAYLLEAKVPEGNIHSLLLSYELEHCIDMECSKLNPSEERRLRILAAVYSKDRVLVINEPFEPLESKWRENFARLLLDHARVKGEIILVPSLSYRPESWIDNEYVARIQVGENIQKTIGFGTGPSSISELAGKLREEIKRGREVSDTSLEDSDFDKVSEASPISEKLASPQIIDRPRSHSVIFAVLSLLAIVFGVTVGMSLRSNKNGQVGENMTQPVAQKLPLVSSTLVKDSTAVTSSLSESNPKAHKSDSSTGQNIEPFPSSQPLQVARAIYLLDYYPPEIKSSILKTIEGNLSSFAQNPANKFKPPRLAVEEASKDSAQGTRRLPRSENNRTAYELLNLLKSASGSGEGLPDSPRPVGASQNPDMSNLTPDQRRDLIRQKFLEAAQRAQAQREVMHQE